MHLYISVWRRSAGASSMIWGGPMHAYTLVHTPNKSSVTTHNTYNTFRGFLYGKCFSLASVAYGVLLCSVEEVDSFHGFRFVGLHTSFGCFHYIIHIWELCVESGVLLFFWSLNYCDRFGVENIFFFLVKISMLTFVPYCSQLFKLYRFVGRNVQNVRVKKKSFATI